jgi:hypothetical protein
MTPRSVERGQSITSTTNCAKVASISGVLFSFQIGQVQRRSLLKVLATICVDKRQRKIVRKIDPQPIVLEASVFD